MKLNLLRDDAANWLNGYTNIDPFVSPDNPDVKMGDIANLDFIVENNECAEIRAINVLQYFEPQKILTILDNWFKHLRHNGKLILGGVDVWEVARAFGRFDITLDEFNNFLYGDFKKPWKSVKSGHTLQGLANVCLSKGFKIERKKIEGINFVLEITRP